MVKTTLIILRLFINFKEINLLIILIHSYKKILTGNNLFFQFLLFTASKNEYGQLSINAILLMEL